MSPEAARAALKLAREVCLSQDCEKIALALQQYFEAQRQDPVSDFFKRLKKLAPEARERVAQSLSFGQIDSKLWMMRELEGFALAANASIFVLGGWHGILPLLMHWCSPEGRFRFRSIDIDREATERASSLMKWYELNRKDSFFAAEGDMYELEYESIAFTPVGYGAPIREKPDVVVNTSCEHLGDFERWWKRIPRGTRVVLQSNNYFECPEHMGCVATLEEFAEQAPLSEVHYSGRLPLENYDRFMRIGTK